MLGHFDLTFLELLLTKYEDLLSNKNYPAAEGVKSVFVCMLGLIG